MKRNTIHCIGAFLLSGCLAACGDYLDNVPKGQKIPTTLSDFSDLLGYEYGNYCEDVAQAKNLLNDNYVTEATLSYDRLTRANYMWDTGVDRIQENKSDESTYYNSYTAISAANTVLENIGGATEATESDRLRVAAQAKMLRAMSYFRVVNYYAKQYDAATAATDGGVPLITASEIGAPYTQPSVQGIYDFILTDVKEALPDLPEKAQNVLYADKATGYAFAARVYLQMGNYGEALSAAEEALSRNDELFDWVAFYEENRSVVGVPDLYQRVPSPMGYDFVENYNFVHGSSSYSTTDSRVSLWRAGRFEEGDAEFLSRWKIQTIGAETAYYANLTGYFNRGGLTTTEVWLIKAECLARDGRVDDAMDIVNRVRAKRILPEKYADLSAADITEAVKQVSRVKANALVLTFVPFCDARRLNREAAYATTLTKTVDGQTYTLAPDSYLWVMPFPQGAVKNSGNGSITQNVDK